MPNDEPLEAQEGSSPREATEVVTDPYVAQLKAKYLAMASDESNEAQEDNANREVTDSCESNSSLIDENMSTRNDPCNELDKDHAAPATSVVSEADNQDTKKDAPAPKAPSSKPRVSALPYISPSYEYAKPAKEPTTTAPQGDDELPPHLKERRAKLSAKSESLMIRMAELKARQNAIRSR
ncbi:MAG: hypothetical protein SGARI_006413, partial [Bacillariaceae sp.]